MNEVIQQIPLTQLQPNPENRRVGGFDQGKLEKLAASIKDVGVQVPAVVRKRDDGGYEIVCGERRWRASKIAGLETLPCVVRALTVAEVIKIRSIENVQREDVHPLDEAADYQQLIDACGYEVETIASELGKSVSYVYQRLKLKDLIPRAREMFVEGKISAGHAILIARLGAAQQAEVVKDGLELFHKDSEPCSVRDLNDFIKRNILLELSTATWKLADEKLLPAVGSCVACPKRTGSNPELFADVGKKDHCTDGECFEKKSKSIVAAKQKELEDEPHLEVVSGYVQGKAPEGALAPHQWNECKKSDPGAMRVLIVEGSTQGRMTYGKPAGRAGAAKAATADPKAVEREKAERAKEKKIKDARESLLMDIFRAIYEKAEKGIKARKEGDDVLGFRRLLAREIWGGLGWDVWNWIAKIENWPKPNPMKGSNSIDWDPHAHLLISEMDAKDLDLFTVLCTFGSKSKIISNNFFAIPKEFKKAAELFGIDIKAMIEKKLKENELNEKDLLPPVPKYLQDGPEDDKE
jgi:ParB/RepB/Spo0J family partition protein